jgi:Cu+-exporting ATPase
MTATDPVCGMAVDPATTAHYTTYDSDVYYFCSAGCQTRFQADPRHYADHHDYESAAHAQTTTDVRTVPTTRPTRPSTVHPRQRQR